MGKLKRAKQEAARAAEKGGPAAEGHTYKMARCPLPGCEGTVDPDSPFKSCRRHTTMIAEVLYIIDHARLPGQAMSAAERRRAEAQKSKPHIILPGEPAFNATVKEATSG